MLAPLVILVFATVVYSKRWKEYGYRDCCSCKGKGSKGAEGEEAPEEKWTDRKKGHKKPEGGGSEEEGGRGGRRRKGGRREEGGEEGGEEPVIKAPKDGYTLYDGAITGDEPKDFRGEFTKAMRRLQRQVLKRHNKWRRLHGVPPMEHDEKLCRYAQAYAYRLAQTGVMKHRTRKQYGENLFVAAGDIHSMGFKVTGKLVVDAWYDEIKMWDWGKRLKKGCGHFTQVIWKTSKLLGTGIATHGNKVFVVCNYDPRGNQNPYFDINVPRARSDDDDK